MAEKKTRKKREPRPAMVPLSMVSALAKMKPDELDQMRNMAQALNERPKKARARIVQALIQLVA
jgi:hypothetical protein